MKSRRLFGLSLPVVLALFVVAASAADEPPKAAALQDIVYTKAGAVELKLDVARPAGKEGLFPAVMLIHGGAWRAGSKTDLRGMAGEFTKRGYVTVAPQYRFCPKE